jgi:hypothetical protein
LTQTPRWARHTPSLRQRSDERQSALEATTQPASGSPLFVYAEAR